MRLWRGSAWAAAVMIGAAAAGVLAAEPPTPVKSPALAPASATPTKAAAPATESATATMAADALAGPVFHPGLATAAEAALKGRAPILLVLGSPAYAPCQALMQALVSPEFAKKVGAIHIVEVNVDEDKDLPRTFQVSEIPDLVLMTGEQEILAREQGFHGVAALLKWIEAGKKLADQGLWEGTAPAAAAAPAQEATASSGEDLKTFVKALGSPDPAWRTRVAEALAAHRDEAMEALLDGLDDEYLGARVGAVDLLRRLAPAAPAFDPWAAKSDRTAQAAALRQWWRGAGRLPAVAEEGAAPDAEEGRVIGMAVEDVLSASPVRRTEGMTRLVWIGAPALGAVREALGRPAMTDDPSAVRVLEDLRWTILVPPALESQVHARRDLARGTSAERQAAARRLGSGGPAALPALRELINDSDPLIKESALAALKTIGGPNATEAMAVLLTVKDANLRMVAAQALGQAKTPLATKHLAPVVADPDEVVATVAIAAIQEARAKDQAPVLIAALADKRWRVRAAAAQALGKLNLKAAVPELTKLVDDSDAFVQRNAIEALRSLNSQVPAAKLLELARRRPDLMGLAVESLLDSGGGAASVKTVQSLYEEGTPERRRVILDVLVKGGSTSAELWQSFVEKLVKDKDPVVRRHAMMMTAQMSPSPTAFLDDLLVDEDADVRGLAAATVVNMAAIHWGFGRDRSDQQEGDWGLLELLEEATKQGATGSAGSATPGSSVPRVQPARRSSGATMLAERVAAFSGVDLSEFVVSRPDAAAPPASRGTAADRAAAARTAEEDANRKRLERAAEIKKMHGRWHGLLAKSLEKSWDLRVAAAFYVTGDGRTDLAALDKIFDVENLAAQFDRRGDNSVIGFVMKRLPWPEAKERVAKWCRNPGHYAMILEYTEWAPPELRRFVCQEEQVVWALEHAKATDFTAIAQVLLGNADRTALSFKQQTPEVERIVKRLVESTQPMARALGVFALGRRTGEGRSEALDKALKDEDPWVRLAAVRGAYRMAETQEAREARLGPLVADSIAVVATAAARALLDDTVYAAANLRGASSAFEYDEIHVWSYVTSSGYSGDAAAPVMLIDRKPAFLEAARRRLTEPHDAEDTETPSTMTLLLAQYGDFSGLEKMLGEWEAAKSDDPPTELLIGLTLSKDRRFLPPVRKIVAGAEHASELRRVLTYLRGMTGEEARVLRQEINERMRNLND